MNRFMIAGTGSSCGKTTVTCALLWALKNRGVNVSAFKCGPDYIDTMFHKSVLGIPSHNLDCYFCNDTVLDHLLEKYGGETTVIEGVMGFYDGGDNSAYSISNKTNTPVVIVIDCKGMSDSIGAVVSGFLNYKKPNNIIGFIFNRLSPQLIPLAEKICRELGTGYFGCFPKTEQSFDSRHLGLVTADETEGLEEKLRLLGEWGEKHLMIDELLSLDPLPAEKNAPLHIPYIKDAPTIAVARDEAFCFIYDENIDLLREMGCKTVYFSPLHDTYFPEAQGLLLYGGYPELYGEKLSRNISMKNAIKDRIALGMPVIAECGGFLYLHDTLTDMNGTAYEMCGVIRGNAYYNKRLTRFGYIEMTSACNDLISRKGQKIKAHEFHYYESENCGEAYTARKLSGKEWKCVHGSDSLYAGFPHIYFYSDTEIPRRFIEKCISFGEAYGKNKTDNSH